MTRTKILLSINAPIALDMTNGLFSATPGAIGSIDTGSVALGTGSISFSTTGGYSFTASGTFGFLTGEALSLSVGFNGAELVTISGSVDIAQLIADGVRLTNMLDGDDPITGSTLNDILVGWSGNDTLDGGEGNDTLQGNQGNDTIYGRDGNDELRGGKGEDYVAGGLGDDVVRGALGNDLLSGGAGNDQLIGGQGRDSISGGTGDDFIYGLKDADVLNGGSGADTFVFVAGNSGLTENGVDYINDFVSGEDKIDTEGFAGTNGNFTFYGTMNSFSAALSQAQSDMGAASGQIQYFAVEVQNSGGTLFTTYLFIDDTGDGAPDQAIRINETTESTHISLVATDII